MSHTDPAIPIETLLEHRAWVRALARALVFDEHRAADLEQQVWLEALRKPPGRTDSPRGWLATVLRRASARMARADARRTARERAAARGGTAAATGDLVAMAELHERVVHAVLALAEPYRTTLLCRYFEDLPPREIARKTNTPVETVRARVRRGLERLRAQFDSEHRGNRRTWSAALLPLIGAVPDTAEASLATGVLLMSTKTKLISAAIVVVALLATLSFWLGRGEPDTRRAPTVAESDADRRDAAGTNPKPEQEPTAEPLPDGHLFEVVSARGEPVPAAELSVVREGLALVQLIADRRGRAALAGVHKGTATVWASARGRALKRMEGVELAAPATRIVLEPGQSVALLFVTPDGEPILAEEARRLFAGRPARAELVRDEQFVGGSIEALIATLMLDPRHWRLPVRVQWDASGARLVYHAPEGRWRLFLSRPGSTPYLTPPFTVADGESPEVVLSRTPHMRRVRLVDAETGLPVAGATVTPYYEHGDDQAFLPGAPLRADDNGEVALPLHERREGERGRAPTWWIESDRHLTGIGEIAFADGLESEVRDIPVFVAARLSGKAYQRTGKPAVGAIVITGRKGRMVRAFAGEDGAYRIEKVPVICLGKRGVVSRRGRVTLIEDLKTMQVTFAKYRLEPGREARIDIGEPVERGATATIAGRITSGSRGLPGVHVVVRARADKGLERFAKTAADGRYEIAGLPIAEVKVSVWLGDPRAVDDFKLETTDELELEAGAWERIDIDLPAGAIEITVIDAETGKPVPGAIALARPMDPSSQKDRFAGFRYRPGWAGFADARGVLLARALPEGLEHRVEGGAQGYEDARVERILPGPHDSPAKVKLRLHKKR